MMRTTQADLDYWVGEVNDLLTESGSNRRVITRKHHTNSLTRLMDTDLDGREVSDYSIATGTKGEIKTVLLAMVKMYYLTKS